MLAQITLLTSFAFSFIYPLCFWLSYRDPLKNNFHHFHTATPNIVGGIVMVFLWRGEFPYDLKILTTAWFVLSFLITSFYWRKDTVGVFLLTLSSLYGAGLYFRLLDSSHAAFAVSLLANAIFCVALFAMNLGHWYLNVHGLPIIHLKRASLCLAVLISLRALWDVFYLATGEIIYDGEVVSLFHFMISIDGIFILVGLAFGVFLPIAALWMVKEILKLKNTQATTGILYVILCSIILADLTFKYYFIQYGILL